MMRNIIITLLVVMIFSTCKKTNIEDVLTDLTLSSRNAFADGQTTVNVTVKLTKKSSSDRRNIIFSTSSGVFTNSGSPKFTAKAEFEEGVLVAKATVRMPTKPGNMKITVQPEFDSPVKEFAISDSIIVATSEPSTMKIEPSSFGIGSNFSNDVRITCTLKNSNKKFVSQGYSVLFEDFQSSGTSANGKYLKTVNPTNDSSFVRTFFSVPFYLPNTTIKVRATLLDANNVKTNLRDSIILTVNN